MLALRGRARQIVVAVVADEQCDGAHVMGKLLGTRERVSHQTRNSLLQDIVEALEMIDGAGQLADRSGLCRGHPTFIHHVLIHIKRRLWTGRFRNLGPQLPGMLAAVIARMAP